MPVSPEFEIQVAYAQGYTAGQQGQTATTNPYASSLGTLLGQQQSASWLLGLANGTKDRQNVALVTPPVLPALLAAIAIIPYASVIQLNSVPFIVVPAVPGMKIIPEYAIVEKLGAAAFTVGSATRLELYQNNLAGLRMASTVGISTWAAFAAYARVWCGGPGNGSTTPRFPALDLDSSAIDVPTNVPIVAGIAGGNLSGGSSDLRITVAYRLY